MSAALESPANRVGRTAVPGPSALSVNGTSTLLPLRFMITGILALITGMLLPVLRPEILSTYHYNQYVLAATHLFVLGWVSTIVMGAMYQLVPVALETRLYSERLARWQFLFHLVGFVGMVWMFWTWNLKQVGHYGCVLLVGVGLFVYNLIRTLWRVPRWNVIATGVAAALTWLTLAVLAGLTIAAGKCTYETSAAGASGLLATLLQGLRATAVFATRFDPIGAMHAHAHLGAVGVFLMLIVGISYKLLPMFTLSEIQSMWRARISIALLNLGLLGSFFTILLRSPAKIAFAIVAVAGLAIYGYETFAILRARKRRTLDWGVKYFLTALCLLLPLSMLALVLSWPGLPFTAFTGQLENLYGFLGFIGVFSLAIIGMLYKIVPFLVWYKTYSNRIGLMKVPALADLYSHRIQALAYWTYLAGLAVTTVAILLASATIVRWGAALLTLSLLFFAVNIGKILRHLVAPVKGDATRASTPHSVPAVNGAMGTLRPTT